MPRIKTADEKSVTSRDLFPLNPAVVRKLRGEIQSEDPRLSQATERAVSQNVSVQVSDA